MNRKNPALLAVRKQIQYVQDILESNEELQDTLRKIKQLEIPNWYIGGGSIAQIIWNNFHNFNWYKGIDDFDIVYFDKENISKEKESNYQARLQALLPNCRVRIEVVNEARVHLWFKEDYGREIFPFKSSEDAIRSFPTTSSAIGIKLNDKNNLEFFIPRGLTDLLEMVVRANKIHVSEKVYAKKAKRWKKEWPQLRIIPWNYLENNKNRRGNSIK
jgi:hypothetical protein